MQMYSSIYRKVCENCKHSKKECFIEEDGSFILITKKGCNKDKSGKEVEYNHSCDSFDCISNF